MSSEYCCSQPKKTRVIAYIDGFNLYYGLKNASRDADRHHLIHGGDPRECLGRSLYWLDIEAVVLGQMRKSEVCVAIKYFSAPRRSPALVEVDDVTPYLESNERQRLYLEALRTFSRIQVILGWYSENQPNCCAVCGHRWPAFEEKVTDVNIATHMLCDAYEGKMDRAVVMSADADLVPAVEAVQRVGPEVLLLLPPGRKRAQHLKKVANSFHCIKIKSIRERVLDRRIERGHFSALLCPAEWTKPYGWVWNDPAPFSR